MPRELTPIYILIWRLILTYFTLGFGFLVFSSWVRQGLKGVDQTALGGAGRASAMSQTCDDSEAARPRLRRARCSAGCWATCGRTAG